MDDLNSNPILFERKNNDNCPSNPEIKILEQLKQGKITEDEYLKNL